MSLINPMLTKMKSFKNKLGFSTCRNKGFHITFKNGVTVSTQIGPGNYCDNYNEPFDSNKKDYSSSTAEVAVWVKSTRTNNSTWITEKYPGGDCPKGDVLGYKEIDKWLDLLKWASNYKPSEDELKGES